MNTGDALNAIQASHVVGGQVTAEGQEEVMGTWSDNLKVAAILSLQAS